MFDITLIVLGKLKEKFYISAAQEYEKRLKGYCRFQIIELPEVRLPESPSPAEISAGLEKEADMILAKIPKNTWFCVLTPEGKMLSSEALAEKMCEVKLSGIMLSWEGITSRGACSDSKGLIKKIALKDNIYIIVIDKTDLKEIYEKRNNVFSIVFDKYILLKNEIDYSKYIKKHECEEQMRVRE